MGAPHKPGRKKYAKPTVKELEERVDEAGMMVISGHTKSQIHRILCEKYDVVWQTVDTYLSRAKEAARERSGKTKKDAIDEAVGFYEVMLRRPNVTVKDMMLARERLDKIFGVYQPTQVRLGTNPGEPLQQQSVNLNVTIDNAKPPEPTTEQLARWAAEDESALAQAKEN